MPNSERFTVYEGFSILAVTFLFSSFSGGLSRMARDCGSAGWIAMIVAALLSLAYFLLYYLLAKRFRCQGILEITSQVFGKAGSKLITLLLFLYFLVYTVENVTEATNQLIVNTYAHFRPITVAMSMLAVAGVVALYPVKGLARIFSVTAPLFFASIAFILLMGYRQYDYTYLFPLLGHGIAPIAEYGVFHLVSFDGLLLITLFWDSFDSEKSFRKSGLWALVASNAYFIASALFYNMSGPYQTNQKSQAGLLDLARSIYINRFFQRFESVFIIFVSLGKILVICLGVAAMLRCYNHLFSIPDSLRKKPLLPILLLSLGGGMLLFNQQSFWTAFAAFTEKADVIFAVAVLLALLLVGFLRRKGGSLRAAALLLACCLSVPLLGGCAQISEPDEEIFAIIMGYDRSDSETLRITMKMLPEDKNSAGGSGGGAFSDQEGGTSHNVFTVDAPCNIPAADLINSVIPKHVSLLHVKMLVISEELAREDIDMLISSITRYDEIKPTVGVIICDGTAEEFISAKTSELIPFLTLETEMILKPEKESANYLVRTMGDVYHAYSSSSGDALAMYGGLTMDARAAKEGGGEAEEKPEEKGQPGEAEDPEKSGGAGEEGTQEDASGDEKEQSQPSQEENGDPGASVEGNVPSVYYDDPSVGYLKGYLPGEVPVTTAVETQIIGMAVFRETRMVGTLNSHETQMFMIADGSFNGAVLPVRDPDKPDYYVMYYAATRKPTKIVAVPGEDGNPRIDVEAYFQVRPVVVHNSSANYQEPEERERLRQYTTDYLEEEIHALIRKTQEEYESDILRLGRYMAKNFLLDAEWEEYNWRERYRDAEINFTLDLKL